LKRLKKVLIEIAKDLETLFPKPYKPRRSDVEQVVFTILSQNTTDLNAERCVDNLKRVTKGNLKNILNLKDNEIIEAIKMCGMYNQKLKAIKTILKSWDEVKRKVSRLPTQEAIKLLTSFPYIGPKTARVILTFTFNKNTFPIDTHINRIFKRIGIFPTNWKKEDISRFMEENFDVNFNRNFHYNLIRFGRTICKARNPKCNECLINKICRYRLNDKIV